MLITIKQTEYETLMDGLIGCRRSNSPQRSMKINQLLNYLHMKNKIYHLFAVGIAFLMINSCSSTGQSNNNQKVENQEAVNGINHMTDTIFKQKVFNYTASQEWKFLGDKPVIIDFYADWCGPCRTMSPILEEIAKEYEGKITVYKVNTDKEKILSQNLGIQSLPTFVLIPMNGQPQAIMGAMPKADFLKAIKEVIKL